MVSQITKKREKFMIIDFPDYQANNDSHYEITMNTSIMELNNFENAKEQALLAMDELTGWCSKFKAAILMDLILQKKAKTVVEIGVWGGKSLIPMAFAIKSLTNGKVYGIDPWSNAESALGMNGVNQEWWGKVDHEAIYQNLVQKINKFNLQNTVSLIRATSKNASPIAGIDVLHIDGNHSEEASFLDVQKWVPLVSSGGLIIFDDTTWGTTARAVNWLNENCTKMKDYHDEANDWGIWIKS